MRKIKFSDKTKGTIIAIVFSVCIVTLIISILIITEKRKPEEPKVIDVYKISKVTFYDIKFKKHLYTIKVWDGDSITYASHSVDCKCKKQYLSK